MIHFIPYGELELVEQHQIGSNLSWSWWWCQDDDRQDLVEQHQMGSNPDYGIPTPTLVSPPKVEGCFFLSDAESSRGYFRAPSICPARTSTLALLRPIWRLPSLNNTHLTGGYMNNGHWTFTIYAWIIELKALNQWYHIHLFSAVQRMTVVAKKKGAQYFSVFVKVFSNIVSYLSTHYSLSLKDAQYLSENLQFLFLFSTRIILKA